MEAAVICVEADVCDGLPVFSMVGYLASEVKEARERVRIAIKNSGFLLKPRHITVNLSPADVRKEGTSYDLPAAVAVLTAFGHIFQENLKDILIVGELSLDGRVKPVNGILPVLFEARKQGFSSCMLPFDNWEEASRFEGIQVIGVKSLGEAADFFNKGRKPQKPSWSQKKREEKERIPDFLEIAGQENLKRALMLAAAGWHNALMIGPPGSGKTMAARRVPGILPQLSKTEALEISRIYSAAGLLKEPPYFMTKRPFRAPHHTITPTALAGGGTRARVGEITLAHGGVLFLDELLEFKRAALEVLRQPMEEGKIQISRLHGSCVFPAEFLFLAAMNPCSCGYYPDTEKCTCTPGERKQYFSRLSGPVLDRIDLNIEVSQVEFEDIRGGRGKESSAQMAQRVAEARKIQARRYEKERITFNGQLSGGLLKKYIRIGVGEESFLEKIFEKKELTARAYFRVLKVARTIADLDGEERIGKAHLAEAVFYRSLDKKYRC